MKDQSLSSSKSGVGARWSNGNFAPTVLNRLALPILSGSLQLVALRSVDGLTRFVPYAVSQAVLLIFLITNWKWRPIQVLALGVILNWIPMMANGGYMPITPQAMGQVHPQSDPTQWVAGFVYPGSKDVVLSESMATFGMLGDVFVMISPFPIRVAFSLGDVVILMGLTWTMYNFSVHHFSLAMRGKYGPNRSRTSRLRGSG